MYKTAEGLWVRNSGEEGVREQQREYKDVIQLFSGKPCEAVWDVGAHVGWFPWYVNKHLKPTRILCVECSPRQLEMLRKNRPSNVEILAGALVADDYRYGRVELYLGKTYSSCDSTYGPIRGRDRVFVKPVKMKDLVARLPNPTLIKLDCEGAEYHLDPRVHIPRSVEVFVAELHYNRPGQKEKMYEFLHRLEEIGFTAVRPLKESNYKKTSHVAYVRG